MKNKNIQLWTAVGLVVVGLGLIVAAFCVPPTGEIHPSVLTAFGEILTFAGALMGIDYNYKFKRYNVEIKSKDKQKNETVE